MRHNTTRKEPERPSIVPWYRSHWVTFACLLPLLVMLAAHRALGLSDAMMVEPCAGEPHSMLFNILLVLVAYGCYAAYFCHTIYVANRSGLWASFKVLALMVTWEALYWWDTERFRS